MRVSFNTGTPGLLALVRGNQLVAEKRLEEAKVELEKAIASGGPTVAEARARLAWISIQTGESARGLELLTPLVYTILSKPLSRAEFLIGKYTGLILIIWLQVAIMASFFAGVSLLMGAPLGLTNLAALALTAVIAVDGARPPNESPPSEPTEETLVDAEGSP